MSTDQTLEAETEEVANSTALAMGAPVPVGWTQPARWPVQSYKDLRLAVLFLYQNTCQRCGKPGTCCTALDATRGKVPENLLVFCYACIGARLAWTSEEIVRFEATVRTNAALLRRMTGWGLERPKRKTGRPKKRVKRLRPGRPPKDDKHSVLVSFRIRPSDRDRIVGHDPNFDLNRYARERLLAHRNLHTPQKKRINRVGFELKNVRRALLDLLYPYQNAQPDHPLVTQLSTHIGALGALGDELIANYIDL